MKTNFNFAPAEEAGAGLIGTDRDGDREAVSQSTIAERSEELLSEMAPGCAGTIVAIDDSGPVGKRLLDLGLLPGTAVRVLRHAPLGDPAVYELRGYQLCLRRSESARIRVQPDAAARAD